MVGLLASKKRGVLITLGSFASQIDKKSLKIENVVDFCWSPTDPILEIFVPELEDHPARASIVVDYEDAFFFFFFFFLFFFSFIN
jgi:hypothetical protein